jgi:hypothetical protein
MKITFDIGEGKSCWGCNHLIRNIAIPGFDYGIPVLPTCLVFRKQIKGGKGKAERLPECVAAELKNMPGADIAAKREKLDEAITILDTVLLDFGLDDDAENCVIDAQKILEELKA